jgi:hypothetical protein
VQRVTGDERRLLMTWYNRDDGFRLSEAARMAGWGELEAVEAVQGFVRGGLLDSRGRVTAAAILRLTTAGAGRVRREARSSNRAHYDYDGNVMKESSG